VVKTQPKGKCTEGRKHVGGRKHTDKRINQESERRMHGRRMTTTCFGNRRTTEKLHEERKS
jgi:hypothetical protein